MKKVLVAVLAIAVISTTAIVPAMAEGSAAQTVAATQVTGRGMGGHKGQMPGRGQQGQMPGNGQQGQMPGNGQQGQMPGRGQQFGQMPGNGQQFGQMPGNAPQTPTHDSSTDSEAQSPDTQAPETNGDAQAPATDAQQPGMPGNGQQPPMGEGMVDFDQLVKDGTISQETHDAIMEYMRNNAPKGAPAQAPATEGEAPEAPADGENTLLDDLLASGVITQAEYDAITGAQADASENIETDANA